MKKLLRKLGVILHKHVLLPIKKGLIKLYSTRAVQAVRTFYLKKVLPVIQKFVYKATHNRVINVTYSEVIFFKKFHLKITNKRREGLYGYVFIFLWIIGFLIFALYPIFNSLYLSFFKVILHRDGISTTFVAFGNYRAAFLEDPYFVEILINYGLRILLNVPVTIVFALVIAMLINQDVKGKGIWRTIFFLPVIIASGPVIGELIAQGATTLPSVSDYNIIEIVIENLATFLANPIQALFEQILLVLWFAGIQILILLAGLQKIDRQVYEAAMIDGASPWESFWKITLPSIMPFITVSIIYTVVAMSIFDLNEVTVYIRTKMISESTPALTTGYGYVATLAWIFFLVMSLIIILFVGIVNVRKKVRS